VTNTQKCAEEPRVDFQPRNEPTPAREPSQTRWLKPRPERDGCEEEAATLDKLIELVVHETMGELVQSMRWTVEFDPPSHRVVVVDQNLPDGTPYAEFTVDEAVALSNIIAASPPQANLNIGDDLSLSRAELALFGFELLCCAAALTDVS
jgi:hypothetical protein